MINEVLVNTQASNAQHLQQAAQTGLLLTMPGLNTTLSPLPMVGQQSSTTLLPPPILINQPFEPTPIGQSATVQDLSSILFAAANTVKYVPTSWSIPNGRKCKKYRNV